MISNNVLLSISIFFVFVALGLWFHLKREMKIGNRPWVIVADRLAILMFLAMASALIMKIFFGQ